MSDDERHDGVPGRVIQEENRSFKPLRQEVGEGLIEGHEYKITQNVGDGTVLIEFDGVTAEYQIRHMVEDAYERAILGGEADE